MTGVLDKLWIITASREHDVSLRLLTSRGLQINLKQKPTLQIYPLGFVCLDVEDHNIALTPTGDAKDCPEVHQGHSGEHITSAIHYRPQIIINHQNRPGMKGWSEPAYSSCLQFECCNKRNVRRSDLVHQISHIFQR